MGIDKFFEKLGMSKSEPDEAEENIEAPPADPKKQEMPEAPSGKTATIRQGAPETGRGSNVVNISGVNSQQIANCLKEKRPVVINFEGVDDQLYRRILDFVSGTTYALDGNVNSISTRVWLFSPKNVNVSVSKQTNQGFTDMPWEKK